MEVASAGIEQRIYETSASDFSVCLWMPSSQTEWCVHDQETDISGLLGVWTGTRLFLGTDALRTVERCR